MFVFVMFMLSATVILVFSGFLQLSLNYELEINVIHIFGVCSCG